MIIRAWVAGAVLLATPAWADSPETTPPKPAGRYVEFSVDGGKTFVSTRLTSVEYWFKKGQLVFRTDRWKHTTPREFRNFIRKLHRPPTIDFRSTVAGAGVHDQPPQAVATIPVR